MCPPDDPWPPNPAPDPGPLPGDPADPDPPPQPCDPAVEAFAALLTAAAADGTIDAVTDSLFIRLTFGSAASLLGVAGALPGMLAADVAGLALTTPQQIALNDLQAALAFVEDDVDDVETAGAAFQTAMEG